MRGKIWTKVSVFLLTFLILGACSVSEERVLEHAQESFAEKMVQEKKATTFEAEDLSIYIPSYTEVSVVDDYNVVLERNNHVYLLFLNDRIDYTDKEDIMEELLIEEEPFILEMGLTEDNIQGYLVVTRYEEDQYKVVVGFDGAKITTLCTLAEMNDTAELMFDIVQSIERN